MGRPTIGIAERCFVCFFILPGIWPEIDLTGAGFEHAPSFIMMPVPSAAIAGGVKPALVSGHDQAFVSGESDGCIGMLGMGMYARQYKACHKKEWADFHIGYF